MIQSLLILCITLTSFSLVETKANYSVGVLIKSDNAYGPALRNLTSFAIENLDNSNVSLSVKYQEYNTTTLSMISAICSLVEQSVVSVITASSSDDTAIQADVLEELNIPLISTWATDPYIKTENRDFLMLISPSDRYASEAIFDLLKLQNWAEFSILASATDYGINGLIYLQHLVTFERGFKLKNVQYFETKDTINATTATDFNDELETILDSLSKVIVIHCGGSDAKVIFERANEMGMMGAGYVWIATDGVTAEPMAISHNGSFLSYNEGLIGIKPTVDRSPAYKSLKDKYILEKGGSENDLVLTTIVAYDSVSLVYQALNALDKQMKAENKNINPPSIKCPEAWSNGKAMLGELTNVSFSGVYGDLNFTEQSTCTRISYDIMNFKESGFTKVGTWTNSSGLNIESANLTYMGGQTTTPSAFGDDLADVFLRLGIVPEPPLAYRSDKDEDCIKNNFTLPKCWSGFCPELIEMLAKDLNFTYEYIQPEDGTYGGIDSDTNLWTGMVKDLIDSRIDMVGTALAVNLSRRKVVTFLFPFTDATSNSIYKAGSIKSVNKFFFLSPFKAEVWVSILVIIIIYTFLVSFLNKVSPLDAYAHTIYTHTKCKCTDCNTKMIEETEGLSSQYSDETCLLEKEAEKRENDTTSIYNCLWVVSTGFVGHDGDYISRCPSGRFLMFAWWFFVMILTSMYTANLTASLTINRVDASIDNILKLTEQSTYEWGVITNRNMETRLLTHKNDKFGDIVKAGVKLHSLDEAMARVRAGGFVFIDESSVLAYNFREDCGMVTLVNDMGSSEWSFAIPLNSPYRSAINAKLVKLREEETISELEKKWYSVEEKKCGDNTFKSETPVDLSILSGLYILAGCTVIICVVLVILEMFYLAVLDTRQSDSKVSFCTALFRRFAFNTRVLFNKAKRSKKSEGSSVIENEVPSETYLEECRTEPGNSLK